jgi:Fe-S cluster biosynthesis and repair protein YggX
MDVVSLRTYRQNRITKENHMSNTNRTVKCIKLNEELEGLEKAPFSGPTGQLIYEKVSKKAWDMWSKDMQIKVLNEYRLNMGNPKDYQVLVDQMMLFLNLKNDGSVVEVENADRGKGN